MPVHGPSAARLTIHLSGDAVWHHKPAFAEIVHRARKAHLPGATVFHGIVGFGPHLRIHDERPMHLVAHGPCAVHIVGEETQLRAFLDTLEDILTMTGVATFEGVEVHQPSV